MKSSPNKQKNYKYFFQFNCILVVLIAFQINSSAQFTSVDNQNGTWSDSNSWIGGISPGTSISDSDIHCYGEIVSVNCLDIDKGTLHIFDTLIINGNLELKNQARMEVASTGVLMIFGDYTSNNKVEVINDGTIVIAGNFEMLGSDNQGYFNNASKGLFLFDDNPSLKGGSLYASIACINPTNYPAECGYGNNVDFQNSTLYGYYSSLPYASRDISTESNSCNVVGITASSTALCKGEKIVFNSFAVGISTATAITWDFGEGAVPQSASGLGPHSVEFTTEGSKTVTFEVVNDTLLTYTDFIEVQNCTNIEFTSDKQIACIGDTIKFINLSTGISTKEYVLWEFGEGSTPLTYSGFGPHLVYYSTSGAKDISVSVLNDTFLYKPSYVFISECLALDYDIDKSFLCIGDTITFTNSSFESESPDTLIWNFGEDAEPQHVIGKGPHKVIYTSEGEKEFSLESFNDLVNKLVVENVLTISEMPVTGEIKTKNSIDQLGGLYVDEVCVNESREYSVADLANAQVKWRVPVLNINRITNNSISINWDVKPGEYLVFAQEIGENGDCHGTVSDGVVLVTECKKNSEPINYTFTPNDDGYNEFWVVENIENLPLAKVKVFDRVGKLVYQHDNNYQNDWNGTFDGRKLKPDSYYYLIDLSAYHKPSIRGIVTIIH